ncbi:TetR/AcrR family transcriptional regulator [Gordonia sp. KTR9]|uniref:TetR/AcrR family transcriptional regulator n=1 Tax=Gordonia sp. KTR9 TaxID=337191 RepID=UPI00027DD897|nr:TetR/AcrR family transcriptional regulator [Gordonia sp. KTR9]AFR46848.1 Transcriptional regulator [Gordonia sp. KTR9]
MPRASAEAAAETARAVLAAATDQFAERGFADVSLDDVAEAAGVTRGAVYHHFRNKAALFAAVAAACHQHVADAVVAAAEAAGPDPAHQLSAGSHAFVDAITSGTAVRILLIDGPAVVGWEEWRRLDEAGSAAHLREALGAIGVDDELIDVLTMLLSGAMNEAALWLARHPDDDTARDRTHRALDRILGAVM